MKNRISMSLIGIIFPIINLIGIYSFNKNETSTSIFILLGYLLVTYLLYRILLNIIQKILVKCKILKYKPDNFSYYGNDAKRRENINIIYKMREDRHFSAIFYNITLAIVVFIIVKFNNNESIFSSLFVAVILTLPSLILNPHIGGDTGYGTGDITTSSESIAPKRKKIRATTWDFGGYRETTYKDEDGNKVGTATSFDWGPVTDTTIKDKDGNKTKIEHWKF